ncbi:MAG: nuclease-related domain-containing protein [Xenococcaceae cyanobacterium MO_188.B29]|nr:nuclease-related domain-containing protein [Xenococcaceae cyanobacterium MO_188.B29]
MILKEKDPIGTNLEQLENIAKLPNLPKEKLSKIKKEIKLLKSGNKGEKNSAYFIDFYYKDVQNWVVIHDLRVEYDGFVAQIDHLLINRFLDFYVLETKHYAHGVKITERGEFLVLFQKRYIAIESPIEQNQRHIKVLKNLLSGENLLPKRLGFSLQPNFLPYILVSPKSRVIHPKAKDFNTDMLIKADEFYKQTQDNIDNKNFLASVGSIAKIISQDDLKEIGKRLISYHKPIKINYYDKFGISRTQDADLSNTNVREVQVQSKQVQSKYYCYKCKKFISEKVASFCFKSKTLFKGKAYCFDCQKLFAPQ